MKILRLLLSKCCFLIFILCYLLERLITPYGKNTLKQKLTSATFNTHIHPLAGHKSPLRVSDSRRLAFLQFFRRYL